MRPCALDKCNLPISPQSYPLSASILVTRGGASGKCELPLPFTCTALAYCPVKKLVRLGVQIGLWQYAWVNANPSEISRSILGVSTWGLPSAPMVSYRCWSVQIHKMFGFVPFMNAPFQNLLILRLFSSIRAGALCHSRLAMRCFARPDGGLFCGLRSRP